MAKFLIVEARFYDHLNDMLVAGAKAALKAKGHEVEVITVPGALEIPGTIAMAAANISLFMASPVVGALAMLGWGAGLGGIVGVATGAKRSKGDVADLVKDALASSHVVLVAHTATEEETSYAQQIIGASMIEPTDKPGAVGGTPALS